jgi:carbamoyltransferase
MSCGGGVALNCVANGRILREGPFKDIWIQPASGDAGGALGAALSVWYEYLGNERNVNGTDDMMQGSYLGPSFSDKAIADFISGEGLVAIHLEDDLLFDQVAQLLAQGNVVGWFTGRMEFGPRALGHRSILGDARNTDMQTTMNLKIKFRESFRPFAPAVLDLDADKYFILHEHVSPYMLLTTHVREEHRTKNEVGHDDTFGIQKLRQIRSTIPAVTHVDYSARVQTVTPKSPRFHKLLQAFKNQTGCSVLVNTSFNVRGEPVVCTPEDAYQCFMRTQMDYLVLENYIFAKNRQPDFKDDENWQKVYELD